MFEILTASNGTFSDIRLLASRLTPTWDNLLSGAPYTKPIILHGANRVDEVRALLQVSHGPAPLLYVDGVGTADGVTSTIGMDSRVSKVLSTIHAYMPGMYAHFRQAVDEPHNIKLSSIRLPAYANAVRAEIKKRSPDVLPSFDEYVARLEIVIADRPLISSLDSIRRVDHWIPWYVWSRKPRPFPLILLNTSPVKDRGIAQIEAQSVSLPHVLGAIEERFRLDRDDVENAHRIWSLSRRRFNRAMPQPRDSITVSAARELCEIVSETFQNKIIEQSRPKQQPAPIKFQYTSTGIGVSGARHASDSDVVVRAAAQSIKDACERILQSGMHNHIPHFHIGIGRAIELLGCIVSGNYDDGHIVSLGLELNALQWQIDAIKQNISQVSLAEATGLFANTDLFLDRFSVWSSFRGHATESPDHETDGSKLARAVLVAAEAADGLLDLQASTRVGTVLRNAQAAPQTPVQLEGLMGSGENLTAAVVSGLSEIVAAKERAGGEASLDAQESAVVDFAIKNEAHLMSLASARERPWADWGAELIAHARQTYRM